jgi:hypothetical protein
MACIDTILPNLTIVIPALNVTFTVTTAASWSIFFCGSELVSYGEKLKRLRVDGASEVKKLGDSLKRAAGEAMTSKEEPSEKSS